MFITADLYTILHAKFVGMFITYHHTQVTFPASLI